MTRLSRSNGITSRLRVWIGEENADSHDAHLNWLIARSSETCTGPYSAQPECKRAVPVATGQASTTTMKTVKPRGHWTAMWSSPSISIALARSLFSPSSVSSVSPASS